MRLHTAAVLIADVERAPQLLHALRQAAQAEMPGPRPVGRQADAVVGHRGDDSPGVALHGDVDARGLRVPQGVDQTLLHHAVDRRA